MDEVTIRASDDFNRANANPIGGNWSTPTGGGAGLQIVGNQLKGGAAGPSDAFARWTADTPPADHYCKITFGGTENAGSDVDDGGPCVRFTAAGNGYLFNVASKDPVGDTTWVIFSLIACVGTSIATGTLGRILVPGVDIIECRCNGSTISGWVNGVQVASVTDTLYPSGGGYGIHVFEGPANASLWDDFEGGDFVTATTLRALFVMA